MKTLPRALRVLLVEDHDDSREMLARLLTREGHTVTAVCNCGEALVAASVNGKNGHAFELIIADIGLPDGDGVDLMQTLSKEHKLTTIALTGHGADADIQRCKNAGINAHLLKPTRLDELIGLIQWLTPDKR